MPDTTNLCLAVSDGRPPRRDLTAIQEALSELGIGIWPLDLTPLPEDLRALIREPVLSDDQNARLLEHFLIPRERLLEIIAEAGREPHVEGGGELTTRACSHGYSYPQLYVMQGDEDFTRFDRMHVNTADDETAVDEFIQMLCGSGLVVHDRRADGVEFTLDVKCPDRAGWLIAHDGGVPHMCNFGEAAPGSKCLVQVIGPPQWEIRYVD